MLKRLVDLFLSLSVLLAGLPFIVVLALLVRFNLGSPIFFKQTRPGRQGIPFDMLKFRSMTGQKDKQGNLLADDERLTRFGKFIRSTSLDELPGLLNVIRGHMSLVGPRPLLMEYLPLYSAEQSRRHQLKPGITGWAQVNGRNALSWEDKFKLDVWYVDNQSFFLDLKILLLTIVKVLKRSDINQDGEATMTKFMGSKTKADGSE